MDNGVLVSNIHALTDQTILLSFFGQFGIIEDFSIQPDKFNIGTKICYLKYSTNDSAIKAVKMADKTTNFGGVIRVALKVFVKQNSNGIKYSPSKNNISFGRGRGTFPNTAGLPLFVKEPLKLKDIVLPLENKFVVEIVELKSFVNICVRPLLLTEPFRSNLYGLLEKVNEESDHLIPVKNPEINHYYLAKWAEDNKFYRSKIIQKLDNNKFEVCFVDEGTIGDIVTELRMIPEDLWEIPCQFMHCTVNCTDSPELIELVLKEGSDSEVSIYATTNIKVEGKQVINIFINEKDIIDIYKSKYSKDPRIGKHVNRCDINIHELDKEYHNCQLIKGIKEKNQITVTFKRSKDINASELRALTSTHIPGDVLIYIEDSDSLQRCVIESVKFEKDRIKYCVILIDENRLVEVTSESLMRAPLSELNFPIMFVRGILINGDLQDPSLYNRPHTVVLTDYDARKDLYVVEVVQKKYELCGQVKMGLVSHIETANEFYVQFMDNESLATLAKIQGEVNSLCYQNVKMKHAQDLRLHEVVVAPFQGVNYRALVLDIDGVSRNGALLNFIDFGNCEWTKVTDIMKTKYNVPQVEPLAHRCRLPVTISPDKVSEVTSMLTDYCDAGESELSIKINDIVDNILEVDVIHAKKTAFIDLLQKKKLLSAPPQDLNDEVKQLLMRKITELETRISLIEKFSINR